MSKLRIFGMIIAILLLILALAARFTDKNTAAAVVLPIMSLVAVALAVVDILAYRKDKREGKQPGLASLIRIISLIVITLLLIAAAVINIVL